MAITPPPDAPQAAPPAPAPVAAAGACPRCGTPYEQYQEYCLECGLRLPLTSGVIGRLHAVWTRRLPWYPGDWIWPVLFGLLVAALGAAVAIRYAGDDEAVKRSVATTAVGVTLETSPALTETAPVPTEPAPVTTTPPAATTAPVVPEVPPPGALREWPAGQNGYTVVLASLPASGGRGPAAKKAREASRAGLADVGVIDSGDFSSLHPGYYVIFSGVYGSNAEAQTALEGAKAAGFPQAYPRQITR